MKLSKQNIPYIVIVILFCIVGWQSCSYSKYKSEAENNYSSIVSFHEIERTALIQDSTLKANDIKVLKQNIISHEAASELLNSDLEGFTKINSLLKAEIRTHKDNVKIGFEELSDNELERVSLSNSSYLHVDSVLKYFIRAPRDFQHKDQWVTIDGVVKKSGILFNTISSVDKFDAILGYRKPEKKFKLLRKSEPILELKSYSPYSEIVYVNNIVVQEKNKAEKILLSRGAFFAYGFITNSLLR